MIRKIEYVLSYTFWPSRCIGVKCDSFLFNNNTPTLCASPTYFGCMLRLYIRGRVMLTPYFWHVRRVFVQSDSYVWFFSRGRLMRLCVGHCQRAGWRLVHVLAFKVRSRLKFSHLYMTAPICRSYLTLLW